MIATLHYLYDPLCGWCYGAEPLVHAARDVFGLEIALHGGGLWPQPTQLPDDMRRYIKQADARVGQMSGQPYGEAYLDGLLFDPGLVLDSRPTTAAVLAAEALAPRKGLDMLQAIQHAHYEHGRHVVEHDVLLDLGAGLGFERGTFERTLGDVDVDGHIASSRRLMGRLGANGFPTFALQIGEHWLGVPHQRYASSAQGFADWLGRQIATHASEARA